MRQWRLGVATFLFASSPFASFTFISAAFVGCLSVGLISTRANAAELTETWTSVRALGMGNAYTAVVADSDALFYNPAGLARRSGFHWQIFDPRIGINGMDAYESFQEFADDDDLARFLDSLYGENIWVGGGAKTVIQIGGLAAGAFSNLDVSALLQNPAYPVLDLQYAADYGFVTGFGFDFIPELAKMGIAFRRITRVGTAVPIGASTLATLDGEELEAQLKNRGTGYGMDLGFVLTAPSPVRPSLSFVWRNMGLTSFSHDGGSTAPARILDEMIFGTSLEISVPFVTITPSFDYKHANRDDVQLGKKIHMGIEVSLPLIDIRAGLNQGYYTLGAGLSLGLLQFDVATYGVELGAYPGQLEDRRYIAQLTLELGFDPSSFGFGGSKSGSGGGRSKLKQRR